MKNKIFQDYETVGKLILLLCVLAVLFAVPLSAAENVKINLPDGLYMYDSSIERLTKGGERVGFGKYFIVKNNIIYSSQEAMKNFGVLKLNELFTENKKYKILFGGENIGKIYNVKIDDEGDWNYEEELLTENIKEGPMYGVQGGIYGSVVKCIAVPKSYKEAPRKAYTTISKEEVDKISELAKNNLFDLIKNRKEVTQHKIKKTELVREELQILDKISHRNHELYMYIGIYLYVFKTAEDSHWFGIIFSARKDSIYVITSNYDDENLWDGRVTIYGKLDVDGCGEDELLIEKEYESEDETTVYLEIYKQKADGIWKRIVRIKRRRVL